MARSIEWHQGAISQLAEVYKYVYRNWGIDTAESFLLKIQQATQLLREFPELGVASPKLKNLRVYFVTQHNGLYYRYDDKKLVILKLLDTRSDFRRP